VVPDTCVDSTSNGDVPCPSLDFTSSTFGIGDNTSIAVGEDEPLDLYYSRAINEASWPTRYPVVKPEPIFTSKIANIQ